MWVYPNDWGVGLECRRWAPGGSWETWYIVRGASIACGRTTPAKCHSSAQKKHQEFGAGKGADWKLGSPVCDL